MSWEDVSVSPRKLRRDLNESEKLEIIKSDEIPPNDYSAEAVAKSLLHVSSQNRVFTMSFIYSVSVPIYRIFSSSNFLYIELSLYRTFFISNFLYLELSLSRTFSISNFLCIELSLY